MANGETSSPTSRYGIANEDLREAALALQLGQGIADRINSADATQFIVKAEDWTEEQVEEYVGVPLRAVRAPGQSQEDFTAQTEPTRRNYPLPFTQAIVYRATGLLIHSEFFENAPNVSEAGNWALQIANQHIMYFKEKRSSRVGNGRLRHPNPHMPPNIAPRPQQPGQIQPF